jgi:hypothetical protein
MMAAAGRQQPGGVGVVEVEVAQAHAPVLGHGRPPRLGAGAPGRPEARPRLGPVQGGALVRVLAVAQRQGRPPVGQVDRRRQLGPAARPALGAGGGGAVEPVDDGRVVGGGQGERGAGQAPAGGRADLALGAQLVQHHRVVGRVGEHGHRGVVLGRRPHHGRSADVDEVLGPRGPVLEGLGVGAERVHVDHHQVEGLDALGPEVGGVRGVGGIGQDAAVHPGVQGDHPVAQDGGEPGQLGQVGDRQPRVAQGRGGAARGHQVDPQVGQLAGERGDTGLVVDREQGSHGFSSMMRRMVAG